jgi:hypothetical protein
MSNVVVLEAELRGQTVELEGEIRSKRQRFNELYRKQADINYDRDVRAHLRAPDDSLIILPA